MKNRFFFFLAFLVVSCTAKCNVTISPSNPWTLNSSFPLPNNYLVDSYTICLEQGTYEALWLNLTYIRTLARSDIFLMTNYTNVTLVDFNLTGTFGRITLEDVEYRDADSKLSGLDPFSSVKFRNCDVELRYKTAGGNSVSFVDSVVRMAGNGMILDYYNVDFTSSQVYDFGRANLYGDFKAYNSSFWAQSQFSLSFKGTITSFSAYKSYFYDYNEIHIASNPDSANPPVPRFDTCTFSGVTRNPTGMYTQFFINTAGDSISLSDNTFSCKGDWYFDQGDGLVNTGSGKYTLTSYRSTVNCPIKCDENSTSVNDLTNCLACPVGDFGYRSCSVSSVVTFCQPGDTTTWDGNCDSCDSGKYNPSRWGSCVYCRDGSEPKYDKKSCDLCSVGYAGRKGVCDPCPSGSYSDEEGEAECTSCPPGMGRSYGASSKDDCHVCYPGTYFTDSESTPDGCIDCPKGSWTNITGAATCTSCPAGYFLNSTGSKSIDDCLPCGTGQYQDQKGSAECKSCPRGLTSTIASTHCSPCPPGSLTLFVNDITTCQACLPGTFLTSQNGEHVCALCPAATYSHLQANNCTPCGKNRYQPLPGSSECLECIGQVRSDGMDCESCGVMWTGPGCHELNSLVITIVGSFIGLVTLGAVSYVIWRAVSNRNNDYIELGTH